MSRLFIANIHFDADESHLRELFAGFAPRNVILCSDAETGKSKGFGFVEIDDRLASDAIAQADGREVIGRKVNVRMAHPPKPREERKRRG